MISVMVRVDLCDFSHCQAGSLQFQSLSGWVSDFSPGQGGSL